MKWYERMNAWREERDWTQKELSRRSGVEYENIVKYSKGYTDNPRGDVLEKIAIAFDRRQEELMFGVTPPSERQTTTRKVRQHPHLSTRATLQIGAGGAVVIPAEMRAAMGVGEGDTLSACVLDGELRLMSQETALRKAQELVRQYIPEGVSLVDQLVEERRSEARRESGQ